MKKQDRKINNSEWEWVASFEIPKDTTNEEALEMVYKDFSKKIDFVKSIYPYSGGDLHTYNIFYKLFSTKYNFYNDNTEYYHDTFEECENAFEKGIFNVNRDYFGSGEWPIISLQRIIGKKKDFITYTISR